MSISGSMSMQEACRNYFEFKILIFCRSSLMELFPRSMYLGIVYSLAALAAPHRSIPSPLLLHARYWRLVTAQTHTLNRQQPTSMERPCDMQEASSDNRAATSEM